MDWKGRRVFLTGHTGFKGSWLSLWLQTRGAIVRGYSLEPPASPNLYAAARVAEDMESCLGDIRDQAHLQRELTAFHPEIVLHLAAQALVRLSYARPIETYATNVMGTANLLEAVRAARTVRSVVIVTTDKCYANQEWVWPYRESDPLGGRDPYSSSKAAAELVTSAYRSSFFSPEQHATHGVALASARAGNVIGGGDWAADRLLPDMMRSLVAGPPLRIRHPDAVRPWQHVLEPLFGYLLLAEALFDHGAGFGDAWNFGPHAAEAVSVSSMAERIAALWQDTGRPAVAWERDDRPAWHEAGLLRLDCSKAAKELGWRPRLSLDEALRSTVAWYAAWAGGMNMRDFTLSQIAQYQDLVASV